MTVPELIPLTRPAELTVAIAALDVDQLPPATVVVMLTESPWQSESGPEIVPALAAAIIVTLIVSISVPQLLLTA